MLSSTQETELDGVLSLKKFDTLRRVGTPWGMSGVPQRFVAEQEALQMESESDGVDYGFPGLNSQKYAWGEKNTGKTLLGDSCDLIALDNTIPVEEPVAIAAQPSDHTTLWATLYWVLVVIATVVGELPSKSTFSQAIT